MSQQIQVSTGADNITFFLTSNADGLTPIYGATPVVGLIKNGAVAVAPVGAITENSIAAPGTISTGSASSTGGHLAQSTTYYYVVTALTPLGETTASPEKSYSVGATGTSTNQITLTWTAVTGATSYNIYRGTTSGGEGYLANVSTNSYADTSSTAPTATVPPTTNSSSGGAYTLAGNGGDTNVLGEMELWATATNCNVSWKSIQIVAYNPRSATNLGLSALPTASAGAAGGLLEVGTGTGQLNVDGSGNYAGSLTSTVLTAIAGAVWNALTASYNTNNTFGKLVGSIVNQTGDAYAYLVTNLGAFGTNATALASAVWTVTTRILTAGTNIILVKGTGITGFNDIAAPTGFEATTFPSGTVASTTNITAGTLTTITNLTNAPTTGDFTATMKTSLNASTPASIVGNVGGITGVTFPTNFGVLSISIGGKINEVVLVDTLTTYTGNTPASGDAFAEATTAANNATTAASNASAANTAATNAAGYASTAATQATAAASGVATLLSGTIPLSSDTVQSSPAPTTTTCAGSNALNQQANAFIGMAIVFTSGVNNKVARRITASALSGSVVSLTFAAFPSAPSASDTFDILGA